MTEVASAYVALIPSAKGFGGKLDAAISSDVARAGVSGGAQYGTLYTQAAEKTMGQKAKTLFRPLRRASAAAGIGYAVKRGVTSGMADVEGRVQKVGTSIHDRFTGAMRRMGATAAAVGVGYVAKRAVQDSVQLEAAFGKTMSVLGATLDAPTAKLDALAMKMGAETKFSALEASDAMLELARGGMTAATIQGGALQGTLTLAAAGELDMGTAANIAVGAMGQFSLEGKDMADVAAALAGGANASSASVSDMAQALAQGGLAANAVGFSIQETTGILASFSNAGLEGSDAGTSLKTMLDRLQPSTKAQYKAFEQLGLLTEDLESKFVKSNGEFVSATKMAELLASGTDKLSAAQRKRALSEAFGSDAQRAATILAKEGAAGLVPLIKATSDKAAAEKQAAANTKGTAGALEQMHGSIETAQLAFGKAIKPLTLFFAATVTQIANGAVPIIQDLGRELRGLLKGVDFGDGIKGLFANFDVGTVFDRISEAVDGIDWGAAKDGMREVGGAVKEAVPAIKEAGTELPTLGDAVDVFGVVIGFAADHVDTLAKYMPALIAAFIAFKAAQAVNNALGIAQLPIMAAQTVAQFTLAGANRKLAAQMALTNGVEKVSLLTRMKQAVVTGALAVWHGVVAVATGAWTAAQWLLNAAMTANPIGIVIAVIALLVIAIVIAWKKSETFRKIVTAAFDAICAAGRWLWNEVLQPVFKAIVEGMAWVMDMWSKVLGALAKVPGFGWAGKAADAMGKAADKARDMADGIRDIPDKDVKITVTTSYVGKQYVSSASGGHDAGVLDGKRAHGGPVRRGGLYLVGERGPELFAPNQNGTVIPNGATARSALGGGGGRVQLVLSDGRALDAYVRDIADGSVANAAAYAGTTGRMR